MEIIERSDKYKEEEPDFPVEIECEYCGSTLLINEGDLSIGPYGAEYYRCPVCKRKCMADDLPGITLTSSNIEFPKHFNRSNDGVDLDPSDIKKCIKEGIEFFRKNPDAFTYVTGSGNTGVMIQNYSGDEEYLVCVTKDYYSMIIPYEDIDYASQEEKGWEWKNKGINLKKQRGEL